MKQTTTLGHNTLKINRIGLGCIGKSEFFGSFNENELKAIKVLEIPSDEAYKKYGPADLLMTRKITNWISGSENPLQNNHNRSHR